ncbi:cation:proton antiporter domain-containing protein [Rickettsiales endosymbiont of Stachyamoeba lipophora]|uniref:cation:proton antiporter domain-containing protein n=1 Tax=Rickettsiales endosymbiont of Stachyamoeba lipophora TaxID=2486578 RepID=UPI000F64F51B|nr:cation:proton antiporter [Rickettsiales endosymbiont of Stachyamoeba lipophora]AZL15450.1 potassium transporter [Rickettsiales endosymbiont of Stachyamoeba lipophora]
MPHISFLPNIVYLLAAAVIIVAIFRHLKLNPVLGYFVAGSILGPSMLNLVNPDDLSIFAEFGVVFLLFAIGLELTFDRLKALRLYVFGMGTAQVMITAAVIVGAVVLMGLQISKAIIIGMALALSSTAIVLQVVAETRTQSTQVGRLSLAVLLLQDFAVVPLLVLLPLMASEAKDTNIAAIIGISFMKAIMAILLIFIAGRTFLKPFFSLIRADNAAKNNEIFVTTTLLIALAAAFVTDQLGLSLALGAFLAGLLVAETDFQHQAEESIAPFKGIFLGLFFMTVGMHIDFNFIADNYVRILEFSVLLIVVKATIITLLCLLFKFNIGTALHTGLLLSQGGEFAFILFDLAQEQNLIDRQTAQMLLMLVTVTMAVTPLLSYIGTVLSRKLDTKPVQQGLHYMLKQTADLDNHVLLIGFGRVGKMVARLLEAESIHYVCVDNNEEVVNDAKKEQFPVYLGDASHIKVLEVLGIERAQSIIISVNDDRLLYSALINIRNKYKNIPIIVRYRDMSQQNELKAKGATAVVPETYETGLQLGGAVLKAVGISEYEVSRIKNKFRAGNYLYAKESDELSKESEN